MLTPLRVAPAAALVACLIAIPATAQEASSPAPSPAPANLAFVDGVVDVVLGGVAEAADPPVMLVEGDVVRTRDGRAEIVFGDGTLLHISHDSELEVLGNERLRLLAGRVVVRMSHAAVRPYVLDTPASSVWLEAQGEYGITSDRAGRLELTVARGAARIGDTAEWAIRGGQMITLQGPGGRPSIAAFNSAQWDAFSAWSHERVNGVASAASAAQLPYELRPYAPVFDRYGRWDFVAPHGYVWFPSVGAAWRPYYDGSWAFTRYGWTWHGRDRWAWPTHHYGRWGFTGAFWYWIPATAWAPAWVTWSVGSGYVSWAPLGWHAPRRYDTWDRRDHPAYNPWRGWTVLPRQQFGPRRSVRAHAIDGDRLNDTSRRELLSNAVPSRPDTDIAVPGGSATAPGARGNVRRPPRTDSPSRGSVGEVTAVPERRPGASGRRGDDPAYAPPRSWSGGAVERSGGRTDTKRSAPAEPRGGAVRRPGATRDPGTRAAPRNAPSGRQPAARQPQSKGAGGGAAVPRSGGSRRKG